MVSSTPRPHLTPGKDPVPILQEVGWAPGPAWTGGKSRPNRDSIPDRPARSQSLYPLSYPAHIIFQYVLNFGVKLPEDDINVAETSSSNIRIYEGESNENRKYFNIIVC